MDNSVSTAHILNVLRTCRDRSRGADRCRTFADAITAIQERDEAIDHLCAVMELHCTWGDQVESSPISDYQHEKTIRFLVKVGRLEMVKEFGRKVIARWKEKQG
jgi:hypothetical protein